MSGSVSSYCLDLDIVDKSALLQRKYKKDKTNEKDNTEKETEVDNTEDSGFLKILI